MRIFQLCGDVGIQPCALRGSAVHLRAVASALLAKGHEVVSLMSGSSVGPEPYPVPLRVLSSTSDVLRAAEQTGAPDVIYERYTAGHDASLVPGHQDGEGECISVAGLNASQKLGCPFVLEVNSPMILESVRHRGLQPAPRHFAQENKLMREADAVVAVSEPMRRYVAAVRGSDQKIMTVHNGFHPQLFPSPACLDGSPQVIAFCGNPRPWHGLDYLPSMLARLGARGLRPIVRIIGGPVMDIDALAISQLRLLKETAIRESVEDQFDVVGGVLQSRAAQLLSASTVAVAPYRPDPFFYFSPIKIFEYMGAGLPVVSVAQGDIPELLGDAGTVVAPGDIEALARAVEQILIDPLLARDLGARGRNRALANFTWDHAAQKVESVFLELLGTPVR